MVCQHDPLSQHMPLYYMVNVTPFFDHKGQTVDVTHQTILSLIGQSCQICLIMRDDTFFTEAVNIVNVEFV